MKMPSDHIVSAIPSIKLSSLLPKSIPTLNKTVGTNIGVVNLLFSGKDVLPIQGFGYLVPPIEKEPVLGVVFDSSNLPEQDHGKDITRITAMMGGHRFQELFGELETASKEQILEMTKSTISRQLGIQKEPIEPQVSVLPECIPQYLVGHQERLVKTNSDLKKLYPDELSVTGASYLGVSVNDCVASSYKLVNSLVASKFKGITGLEKTSRY
ncbi:oxygen-dependent protoporphyrinogen oxidase [Basidiobolus ranarum]|uniref:Oxygen-dependent protoporphyrinogen oxidase n=1 Tax=Basidiobolus ranarum TaxID=34480 RepID=A0ABR2WIH2_9FUNG